MESLTGITLAIKVESEAFQDEVVHRKPGSRLNAEIETTKNRNWLSPCTAMPLRQLLGSIPSFRSPTSQTPNGRTSSFRNGPETAEAREGPSRLGIPSPGQGIVQVG